MAFDAGDLPRGNWKWLMAFTTLFLFRYVRSVVNTIAFYCAKPTPIPLNPTYKSSDVTVIICTLDILNDIFFETVESVLAHPIHFLILSIASSKAGSQIPEFRAKYPDPRIKIIHTNVINKREQCVAAWQHVQTEIIAMVDDHCFWSSNTKFIPAILAPFEDPTTGAVTSVIEVRHMSHPTGSWCGFWNYLGMTYLVRRTREYLATNTIDGGLCTVPGRWSAFRSSILKDPDFIHHFLNEYLFFGLIGPLNVDEDKCVTRWIMRRGWTARIQTAPESRVETILGEYPKFIEQCIRWTRTTYRSEPRNLVMGYGMLWVSYPWTVYSHSIYGFFRFSLFYEVAMFWMLHRGLPAQWIVLACCSLAVWIVAMKFLKLYPHFKKHPEDIVYFPAGLLFAAMCSFLKIWVWFTLWDISWGRVKNALKLEAEERDVDHCLKKSKAE